MPTFLKTAINNLKIKKQNLKNIISGDMLNL